MSIDAAQDDGLVPATFTVVTMRHLETLSPRLARNPVDLGPTMAMRDNPFTLYEEVVPAVLADPNVDCAAISCYASPPVVEVFRRLVRRISNISKPVTLFGYGFDLAEMEESARQFQAMGLPMYFDVELAVKALGVSAACSEANSRLAGQVNW